MTDVTSVTSPVPEPESPKPRIRGRKRRFAWRWSRRLSLVLAGLLAAGLISFFSIDIGRLPGVTAAAERAATNYLERPMHIGRIRAYLWPGKFVVEDVRIEGRTADAKPFFTAKRIHIDVPWRSLFRRELIVEVTLTGWEMVVETSAAGHNMPKLAPKPRERTGPRSFRTTVPFIHALGGRFTYYDHGTPWNVVAPNLNFSLVRAANLNAYVGTAEFDGGMVNIQNFLPMRTSMKTRFHLDGRLVRLQHIDLITDGAESHINGVVDFGNWPNSQYNVDSVVNFQRMRELFFAKEKWALEGEGRFKGVFQLAKGSYYNLSGSFASDELGFNQWRFPDLHGALEWKPGVFAVTHADARFGGGNMRLFYGLDRRNPSGTIATLTADYDNVDLQTLTQGFDWRALQPDGSIRGRLNMTWPNGRFSEAVKGEGSSVITPPDGAVIAADTLLASAPAPPISTQELADRPIGRIPLAGDVTYRFDAGSLTFNDSWTATPEMYVTFSGRAIGGPADMKFHVTSHDWQESDRVFVAIMRQFSSTPPGAIPVSGRGVFDGTLSESFRAPRIAGTFSAEGMGAWGVIWGSTSGAIVLEKGFMSITDGVIANGAGGTIRTTGRYSLGYRGGEEMNATVKVAAWPLTDFRRAFELDDWPADGVVTSADFTLKGPYREPTGDGPLQIDKAVAWGESFDRMTGHLLFEGRGLRVRNIVLTKGPGRIESEAFLDWHAGTYIFDAKTPADGRIPLELLDTMKFDLAPLTGLLNLQRVHGEGSFEKPTYTIDGSVSDFYAGDEGVGQVQARLVLRNDVLTFEHFDVASSRLQAFGSGSIALNDRLDSRLFLRFSNTSLDPYLRLIAPARVSDFARAIASGSVNIAGPLANRAEMVVTATIDPKTDLKLFDYPLSNADPVQFVFEKDVFKVLRFELQGVDTKLQVTGEVDAGRQTIDLAASGRANLAIIQLFYSDLSAGGAADLTASLKGPFGRAELSGAARIEGGRLKPHAFTHGVSELNGTIRVAANQISLDGLTGIMGEGPMSFTGGITLNSDYEIERYDLGASGRSIHLRVPRGLASTVNAQLALTGPATGPILSGTVDVLTATYRPPGETITDLLVMAAGGTTEEYVPPAPPGRPSGVALGYNIQVYAPVMPFHENQLVTVEGSASVHIGGTFDKPIVTGWVDIERGKADLFGNRYEIRSGSRIDFQNPAKFEPYFNIEANTRVRAAGEGGGQSQTFTINFRLTGTTSSFVPTFDSEPWLPPEQIISLLVGESPNVGEAELNSLRSRQDMTTMALRSAAATLLTSALSSRVAGAVENPIIDTVQVTPVLGREMSLQQMSPDGRLILTKALSRQLWVMYARTFRSGEQEVIRVEYDQSDRLTWVLTRNEDRTFSVEFRVRRVF